ncbi:hypothetical protein ACFLWM_00805 [Chloroflexota bacterium]
MQRLRNLPLRVWTILPLTIIFGAVVFRLSWNILFATATISQVLWGIVTGATAAGYFFILRFLSQPVPTEKLKSRKSRAGTIALVASGVAIATAYLIQKTPLSIAPISKVVLGLSFAVVSGGHFFLVLLIKPRLINSLKTKPVRIGVTVVVTIALTALTIHTIRFLPSPAAAHPFSQVMAILLLAALIAVYPLILKYIWEVWRAEEGGQTQVLKQLDR